MNIDSIKIYPSLLMMRECVVLGPMNQVVFWDQGDLFCRFLKDLILHCLCNLHTYRCGKISAGSPFKRQHAWGIKQPENINCKQVILEILEVILETPSTYSCTMSSAETENASFSFWDIKKQSPGFPLFLQSFSGILFAWVSLRKL